ncbi:lysoplasmalogenase [Celeribacter sp.]|uniref:lysoplasmalogenase n=1 Tax=Celeribacter sp. TaxID=1890673 RepID=UPI003A8FB0E6
MMTDFATVLTRFEVLDLVLAVCALAAALAYFPLSERSESWMRSGVKTLPLVLATILALRAHVPLWLVLGLALSALGDFALSRRGERAFLAGLVAFALAHLAYIALFVPRMVERELIAGVAVFVIGGMMAALVLPRRGGLVWPARAYAVIILAMTWSALGLDAPWRLAAIGACLFLISDLALAAREFRLTPDSPRARQVGVVVWATYIAAQGAILFAFL